MAIPEQVIQRQLDSYNTKSIDDWLSTYAIDAQQFELHGGVLATGHCEMRARMEARFSEPDLHAKLLHRFVMGNIVVDHELITRNFPEGKGTVDMLCVYEIVGDVIQKASFALGTKTLV